MTILATEGNDTLDLKKMSEDELKVILVQADRLKEAVLAELDRWSTVRCHICHRENVAYRDIPFIGWTTSAGFVLCNVCTPRWEMEHNKVLTGSPVDNPVDEIMALLD